MEIAIVPTPSPTPSPIPRAALFVDPLSESGAAVVAAVVAAEGVDDVDTGAATEGALVDAEDVADGVEVWVWVYDSRMMVMV